MLWHNPETGFMLWAILVHDPIPDMYNNMYNNMFNMYNNDPIPDINHFHLPPPTSACF